MRKKQETKTDKIISFIRFIFLSLLIAIGLTALVWSSEFNISFSWHNKPKETGQSIINDIKRVAKNTYSTAKIIKNIVK